MRGRQPAPLAMTDSQRQALDRLASSPGLSIRMLAEVRALQLCADGARVGAVAKECGVTADTVRRWRNRFAASGVEGIGAIAKGRGRKPTVSSTVADRVLHLTLHARPDDGARWSSRALAREVGVSKDTVNRIWRAHGLTPAGQPLSG